MFDFTPFLACRRAPTMIRKIAADYGVSGERAIEFFELWVLCQIQPPLTLAELGAHFGVSRQAIHAKLKAYGLK